jgi:hypothetical protein
LLPTGSSGRIGRLVGLLQRALRGEFVLVVAAWLILLASSFTLQEVTQGDIRSKVLHGKAAAELSVSPVFDFARHNIVAHTSRQDQHCEARVPFYLITPLMYMCDEGSKQLIPASDDRCNGCDEAMMWHAKRQSCNAVFLPRQNLHKTTRRAFAVGHRAGAVPVVPTEDRVRHRWQLRWQCGQPDSG